MIGFVGLSHLGLVSSIAAAAKGFEVVAFDPRLTQAPAPSSLPFFEPGLSEAWTSNRRRIRFANQLEQLRSCEVIFVSLDVPTDDEGSSDLRTLETIVQVAISASSRGGTVVVLSQVPPGTTRCWSLKANKREVRFYCQVETLVFGNALERALHPERIIVGCPDPGAELPKPYNEYLTAFGCPIFRLQYESAELSKIAINAFLVSSVSTTNLLAELCERIGADWQELAATLRLDKRIGPHAYLTAGLGFAGGNLERDLATLKVLSGCFGTDNRLVDAWTAGSRYRRDWVLRLLHRTVLSHTMSPTIGVWGVAYKANTACTKNSPALALIEALGSASGIRAYDPQVKLDSSAPNVVPVNSAIEAAMGADALVIMAPWSEFSSVPLAHVKMVMRGRTVLDPFNTLDRAECAFHGLRHYCLGTSALDKEVVA
jgi:UDPglucose 6-dehydrogenase